MGFRRRRGLFRSGSGCGLHRATGLGPHGKPGSREDPASADFLQAQKPAPRFSCWAGVAERFPKLVREIYGRGHEIGCHSYWHRLVYTLTPGEFREDTCRAKMRSNRNRLRKCRDLGSFIFRDSQFAVGVGNSGGTGIHIRFEYFSGSPRSIRDTGSSTIFFAAMSGVAWANWWNFRCSTLRLANMNYTVWWWRKPKDFLLRIRGEHSGRQTRGKKRPAIYYFHPWQIYRSTGRRAEIPLKSRLRHYTNLRGR